MLYSLQRLLPDRSRWARRFYRGSFGAFLGTAGRHTGGAAGHGTMRFHLGGAGLFLVFFGFVVFAIVGGSGTHKGKQREGEQYVFHN